MKDFAASPALGPVESIFVEGMTCASCVGRVEKAIAGVVGVASASVNLATERAEVRYAGQPVYAAVVDAIRKASYDVEPETFELGVEGMTCASCVGRVEKALGAVPGVVAVSVNLATERATIRVLDKSPALTAAVEAAVRRAGYEPRAVLAEGADKSAARAAEQARLRRNFLIAAALTMPIFLLEMGRHLIPALHMWLS